MKRGGGGGGGEKDRKKGGIKIELSKSNFTVYSPTTLSVIK